MTIRSGPINETLGLKEQLTQFAGVSGIGGITVMLNFCAREKRYRPLRTLRTRGLATNIVNRRRYFAVPAPSDSGAASMLPDCLGLTLWQSLAS
jgi:hypothetical protein